ncbi:MAG: right-handed parallel beta-helix repeat-containing protein [Saprospiraceae bacterium]|nr:right-handed parallel beta-helix repeat-containing protein [Saprospiraceae bacterium]
MWPRCTSGKWESIIVAGNTAVPHHPDMKNDNYPLDPDGPGIVLLRNATIEHASNAVTTRSSGISWPQSEEYWGGFVFAENTKFLNNSRSVEFMKFDHPNFSAFHGCQFTDEDGSADYGVTNWACNGILFTGCTFAELNRTGILVYDGGITVTGSTFKGNTIGVEGYATYPLASNIQIGNGPGTANFFEQNYVAIYGNAINNLFVQNNTFNGNVFSVAVNGESQYQIADNEFNNSWVGIDLVQTGSRFNLINCNTHDDLFGIHALGDNWGMRFWRQDFTTLYDIILGHEGLTPGQIFPNQGGQDAARWNYFSPEAIGRHKFVMIR